MKLYQEIARKLSGQSLQSVALSIGYSGRSISSAITRIESTSTNDNLGLDSSAYDYKYSGKEFVFKLCEVLELGQDFVSVEIDRVCSRLDFEKQCYPTWVFVETYFRRTTQPIFALAVLETQRRFRIEKSIYILPVKEQVPLIKSIIQRHYRANTGTLPFWGNIAEYKYAYAKDRQFVFDIQGNIIDDTSLSLSSSATIGLKKG